MKLRPKGTSKLVLDDVQRHLCPARAAFSAKNGAPFCNALLLRRAEEDCACLLRGALRMVKDRRRVGADIVVEKYLD